MFWPPILLIFALSGVHPQSGQLVDIHGEPWCVATASHVSDVCKKVEGLDVPAIAVSTNVELHARCNGLGKCENHWICEDHRRVPQHDEQRPSQLLVRESSTLRTYNHPLQSQTEKLSVTYHRG